MILLFSFLMAAQGKPAMDPDWSFGGTFFLGSTSTAGPADARDTMPERGFVREFALHGTGYLFPGFTLRARACYGCHGLEVDEAYGEYRFGRNFGIRAGQINVPFGAFVGRHDPAINEGGSRPLPYAMGLMPRSVEFNQGVIPAPFTDAAVCLSGSLPAAPEVRLDWDAYLSRGLKGGPVDLDFVASRDFEDNNGEPAFGGRLSAVWGDVTLGGSITYGRYDPDQEFAYLMYGADLQVEFGPVHLRAEYLRRETETIGPLGPGDEDEFTKHGYYVQLAWPVDDRLTFFLMHDGLAVEDIFLGPTGPTPIFGPTTTDDANRILRYSAGVNWRPHASILLKTSVEYWEFSDFDDVWVFHAGVAFLF